MTREERWGLEPGTENDFWHLTAWGWRELAHRACPAAQVEVEAGGNPASAVAAAMGRAAEKLSPDELRVSDPRYPVLVTLLATRR